MNKISTFLKRHALVIGIVLMFVYTWPIDLANSGVLPFDVPFPIYITLGWGFILVSLLMTGLTLGKSAVITLLKRYVQWRVHWKWYMAALVLVPALWITGTYLYAFLTRQIPDFSTILARDLFGRTAFLPLFIVPFFLVDFLINGEEMGWRGYVLPRLQARHNALVSSLILGVVWGFWHLPKFLPHFDLAGFGWFMVHILAYAVILTWLYNNTGGSLLLVGICHAADNTVSIFLPVANTTSSESLGAYITVVMLEVLTAALVTLYAGPVNLSRTESRQMQE